MSRPFPLTRLHWTGTPRKQANAWRLQKGIHGALCTIWNHPAGWEVRIEIDGEVHRTEALEDGDAVIDTATVWQESFQADGWKRQIPDDPREPPLSPPPVGSTDVVV